jgi:uncharacterized protein YjiS (DUF1127 family)
MDEGITKLLRALLAVALENRDDEAAKARKNERLLDDLGLSSQEIALILGKSPAATAKAIQRSRGK